jgi:hypothetical protein
MINYYFFRFVKKNLDRIGPCLSRPVAVRPPKVNAGTGSIFSSLDRLVPSRVVRGPSRPMNQTVCKTLPRAGPKTNAFGIFEQYKIRSVQFSLFWKSKPIQIYKTELIHLNWTRTFPLQILTRSDFK